MNKPESPQGDKSASRRTAAQPRYQQVADELRTGIAAGNFGCIGNIAAGTGIPIAHTVELLDWATGGPKPAALA